MILRSTLAALSLLGVIPGLYAAESEDVLRRTVLAESHVWSEPIDLDVAANGEVYVVERRGGIFRWDPAGGETRDCGRLDVFTGPEDGLLGMVLHPGFATNHWMFVYHGTPGVLENRLSRFTINNDGMLDPQSQKTLLRIPTLIPKPNHSGGGLDFDADGNLYLGVGDYTVADSSSGFAPLDERPGRTIHDSQRTAANTMDWHGKIIRIHPVPDGSYIIPPGNLFPPGQPLVLPEIYVMGVRNPFRLAMDRTTGRLVWGDVGPDALAPNPDRGPAGFDEFNVTRTAGNFGWPYFVADNRPYRAFDFATHDSGPPFDASHPTNNSVNNTGRKELPPARGALIWYPPGPSARWPMLGSGARSAMAGPTYHFRSGASSRAWPSGYDGAVIVWDWERGWILALRLDDSDSLVRVERLLPAVTFHRPISARFGRDGALYLLEWGSNWWNNQDSRLVRIESTP